MHPSSQALLLRIFIGEDRRHDGRPLYEDLVIKAKEHHLAGATVLRGPMGFGHATKLHTAKILRLSQDMPIVVEIVDVEEKIRAFVTAIEPIDRQRPGHSEPGRGRAVWMRGSRLTRQPILKSVGSLRHPIVWRPARGRDHGDRELGQRSFVAQLCHEIDRQWGRVSGVQINPHKNGFGGGKADIVLEKALAQGDRCAADAFDPGADMHLAGKGSLREKLQ